jgi:hypothetical protein
MKITRKPPRTGQMNTMELDITQEQLELFVAAVFQVIFPNLNADEREFIMTGYTAEDWAAMFPIEENY